MGSSTSVTSVTRSSFNVSLEAEGDAAPDSNPCARAADAATPPNLRLAAIPSDILCEVTRPTRYTKKLTIRCVALSTVTPTVRHRSNAFRLNDAPFPTADAIQPTPKPPIATEEDEAPEPTPALATIPPIPAIRHSWIFAAPTALDASRAKFVAIGPPSADAHRRVEYGPRTPPNGAHTAAATLLAVLAVAESCAKTGPNIRD